MSSKKKTPKKTPTKVKKGAEEIWKPPHKKLRIPKVIISNLGNCRGINGRNLKPKLKPDGYYWTLKDKDGKVETYKAHRVIAKTFLKNKKKKKYVIHLNGNVSDNRVCNLKWVNKIKQPKRENCGPRIKIRQLTLKGKLFKLWGCISDTKSEGFNPDRVSECTRGKRESYKGYLWERDEKIIKGEEWRDAKVDGKKLTVSNMGRVRLNNGQLSNSKPNPDGYIPVAGQLAHRIIANAFIPNPENKPEVNHINRIRSDNRISNLEWATDSEQSIHVRALEKFTNHIDREVVLLDKKGKIINSWKNGKTCGLEYGVGRNTIASHCKKQDIWRGLRLRYKDELV